MTDEDYQRLLQALAVKHLVPNEPRADPHYLLSAVTSLRSDLDKTARTARLLWVLEDRPDDFHIAQMLRQELEQSSPIELAVRALDETGLLGALEDAGPVILGELRRSAVPLEDIQFLRSAGYSEDEIEIFLASVIYEGNSLIKRGEHLAEQLISATEVLNEAATRLQNIPPPQLYLPTGAKKRKLFNGIGKVLGGSITGIGNAMMATGTILAPNPATAAGAIASAAVAVSAILTGVGDLRGE